MPMHDAVKIVFLAFSLLLTLFVNLSLNAVDLGPVKLCSLFSDTCSCVQSLLNNGVFDNECIWISLPVRNLRCVRICVGPLLRIIPYCPLRHKTSRALAVRCAVILVFSFAILVCFCFIVKAVV